MEDIIKSLEDVGYTGELLDTKLLQDALNEGPKSIEYTALVAFLTNELRALCKFDEQVNAISAPDDSVSFLMELSSFLKELGCPYESLTHGHVTDRLADVEQRKILVDYFITELMAARMIQDTKPDDTISLKIQESKEASNLKRILVRLRFPKPPANLKISMMFGKVIHCVEAEIKKNGVDLVGKPIFNLSLTEKQWHTLEQVQKDLHLEYTIRREMLLKRLDCTIQSFQWSDKMKGKEDQITKAYSDTRKQMKVEPGVDMSDLLSAREDLAVIEKTSSASVRKHTKSSINKVIIGHVPDRGGRTNELAPPPPEMPSWQQRTPGPSGGGRGGGGGGGRGRGDSRGGGMHHNDYNRGGGSFQSNDYNRGGGSNYQTGDYNKGGSDYSNRRGSDYNRGNDYNRGGGNDYNRGGGGSDYNRGGGGSDYNRGGGSDYSQGGYNNYNQGSYQSHQNYDNRPSSGYSSFDSAGSYGVYQESKRPKTYDSFQNQKQTYADQYVQESQHNRQYYRGGGGGGGGRGGRGRSQYNRGGY